ncbi:hypothetical protein [Starkeya nomas]|uniref:hypothetical protein n=1 Tax=Starkeya nomas TaxID=2666134 RepID=UPI00135B4432|nr:hypothetical protein [Starkeya nomas]
MKFEDAWKEIDGKRGDDGGAGFASWRASYSPHVPRYWRDHLIAPVRTIGAATATSLKMSYWFSTIEDSPQEGDPTFVSASLRTSPATAWRDAAPSGLVSMLPFEGAQWRFEQPVSFVQFHLPFDLRAWFALRCSEGSSPTIICGCPPTYRAPSYAVGWIAFGIEPPRASRPTSFSTVGR